jgi:hypothetical protein
MSFKVVNNTIGWFTGILASIVYLSTMEASGSFWDCGEFISCATHVQVPHPPGAPLFILLGRIFTTCTPADPAKGVNTLSALASGMTILFLFWTITHFAQKITKNTTLIISAGLVGSLAYAFSDSFWYSAVEAEVYGLSSFFTALIVWLAIKWENRADQAGADRWIVLLFFLIGLSTGVHLLSLLTIPALVLLYYFRKFQPTWKGGLLALFIGCLITGIAQILILETTVSWASSLDIYFAGKLHLPVCSGFTTLYATITILITVGIATIRRRQVQLTLWSLGFLFLGCSTYITPMIRAHAYPAINMYQVDNPLSLSGYLSRDQYGEVPLIKGQVYTANGHYVDDGNQYVPSNKGYELVGKRQKLIYDPADQIWFPRVWDNSTSDFYASWLGISGKPGMADNLNFFITYQLNWMYWRYFLWNFAGRQNDLEGFGSPRDGNWITGIPVIDHLLYGPKPPDSISTQHKGNNPLYCLPLLLGILGFIYQYKQKKTDWIVISTLFFFTGIAIILYLNQPGDQPRERDYAYVGSFYAFAIWIGMGVLLVEDIVRRLIKPTWATIAAGLICLGAVPVLMASKEWDDHDRSQKTLPLSLATDFLESCAPHAILFTFGDNDTYPLWYAQEAMHIRPDIRVINTSLLNMDWYINQVRRAVNESAPIDPIWTSEQVAGDRRDVLGYSPTQTPDSFQDLETMMRQVGLSDSLNASFIPFPSCLVSLPVDTALVRQNGTIHAGDSAQKELRFAIPKHYLVKSDAIILNIIASNHWKRPIYFTESYEGLGFSPYLRQDGLTYRLIPLRDKPINQDWMTDKLLHVFTFGNAGKPGVYFDEENRRNLLFIREAYIDLAQSLLSSGRTLEARQVLETCDKGISSQNMPYGMCSRYGNEQNQASLRFAQAAYACKDTTLALKVVAELKKDCTQQVQYYQSLPAYHRLTGSYLGYELQTARQILETLDKMKPPFF